MGECVVVLLVVRVVGGCGECKCCVVFLYVCSVCCVVLLSVCGVCVVVLLAMCVVICCGETNCSACGECCVVLLVVGDV